MAGPETSMERQRAYVYLRRAVIFLLITVFAQAWTSLKREEALRELGDLSGQVLLATSHLISTGLPTNSTISGHNATLVEPSSSTPTAEQPSDAHASEPRRSSFTPPPPPPHPPVDAGPSSLEQASPSSMMSDAATQPSGQQQSNVPASPPATNANEPRDPQTPVDNATVADAAAQPSGEQTNATDSATATAAAATHNGTLPAAGSPAGAAAAAPQSEEPTNVTAAANGTILEAAVAKDAIAEPSNDLMDADAIVDQTDDEAFDYEAYDYYDDEEEYREEDPAQPIEHHASHAVEYDPIPHLYRTIPQMPGNWTPTTVLADVTKHFESNYYALNNMSDCGRVLVHDVKWPCGIGSQMDVMLWSLKLAWEQKRSFIVSDGSLSHYTCDVNATDDKTTASCFLPAYVGPEGKCNQKLLAGLRGDPSKLPLVTEESSANQSYVRMGDAKSPTGGHIMFEGIAPDVIGAYALSHLWRFTPQTRIAVAGRINTLPPLVRPICAIHVRRGDAKIDGREPTHVKRNLEMLRDMGAACATIYLVTDHMAIVQPELLDELSAFYTGVYVVSMMSPIELKGWDSSIMHQANVEVRNKITINFFAELEVMRLADYFVGSFRSNVGKLVSRLRLATGWDASTSRSVD